MLSCQRCKQSTNGPQAFLLTCRGCRKTWHHRCHMPPVEDNELIQRIRASNVDDKANGLSTWACRRCRKAASANPSVTSGRELTVSSDDRNSLTSNSVTADSRAVSTAEIHVKQEQVRIGVDVHDRQEATPVNHTFTTKRPESSAPKPPTSPTPSRDPDVQMTDITPTRMMMPTRPSDRSFFQPPPHQDTGVPRSVDIVPPAVPEDDVEMRTDGTDDMPTEPTSAHSPGDQATQPSVPQVSPHVRAASLINEREQEVRPADEQPQVNQGAEDDDDPEDLYGPPVERRIIRILPSLAEELREQQRRAAAEKEKKRAPLAPDWIFARHAQDPLWKEVRAVVGGRGRRKPAARKLGDNGLNVNELVGYLTFRNSVREHTT